MPSKNQCRHLLVIAHPDDETLFFAGLLQSLKDWHVVCVTDGHADGLGGQRQMEFLKACTALKVRKAEILKFPDIFESRLEISELTEKLRGLGKFKKVFTHSIVGEYGHRHHQDVSFATHQAFAKKTPVYSLAYNCFSDLNVSLTEKQFKLKTKIIWEIYSGEAQRLLNYLPARSHEGFVKLSLAEVDSIYLWLTERKPLNKKIIKAYRWLIPYFEGGHGNLESRPF